MTGFVADSSALSAVESATYDIALGADPAQYAALLGAAATALPYGYLWNKRRKKEPYTAPVVEPATCTCSAPLRALQLPYTAPGSICPECYAVDLTRPAAALRCPVCEDGYLHPAPATIRPPIVATQLSEFYDRTDGRGGPDQHLTAEYNRRDTDPAYNLNITRRALPRGMESVLTGDGQDERALKCDTCTALLYLSFVPDLAGGAPIPAIRECNRDWESVDLAGGSLHTDVLIGAHCPILYPAPPDLLRAIDPIRLPGQGNRELRFNAAGYILGSGLDQLPEEPADTDIDSACPIESDLIHGLPVPLPDHAAVLLKMLLPANWPATTAQIAAAIR